MRTRYVVTVSTITLLLTVLRGAPAAAAEDDRQPHRNESAGSAARAADRQPTEDLAKDAPAGTGATEENAGVIDTLFWGPEIVVGAERPSRAEELYNLSGFVALIELDGRRERMEDIASILSRTVGVRVKQYGGLGGFATISIRGSSSSQVEFYLDGVPLNDAYTGTTDLADLALEGLERIEVYRGQSPTGFGSSGIGGTVNLVSKNPFDGEENGASAGVEALAGGGTFGTRRYMLSLRSSYRWMGLHLHGGYFETDGDFSFHDDNATPENPFDDERSTRINNDFTRWNGRARLTLDLPGFSAISLNYNLIDRGGGVPGIGANQSVSARIGRRRQLAYLKLKPAAVLSKRLHADATAFVSHTAESFSDPDGDIGLGKQETDNRIYMHGGNIRSKCYPPVLPLCIELFFEGKREQFHPVSRLPVEVSGPDRWRRTSTLALAGDLFLLDERLVLTAGSRTAWYSNEFYDEPFLPWLPPTPQGRISGRERIPRFGFRLHPLSFLTVKGNWGRYYRLPTFFELFGNLGSVTGESELGNERGLNRDIGVILTADRFWLIDRPFLEAVYIDNEVEDLILFFPNSQYTVKPRNIGAATIKGFELSASGRVRGWITIAGNYTYLDGRDRSPIPYYNGNELAGRPAHEGTFQLQLLRRLWSMTYELHVIGSNYLDQANMKRVPAREIHNVSLTVRPIGDGLAFTFEGYNLGDSRISDVSGFPLPGRSFFTTLQVTM